MGWMIANVAREMGFDDQFYFSRVFRKVMGMLPAEYRKRCLICGYVKIILQICANGNNKLQICIFVKKLQYAKRMLFFEILPQLYHKNAIVITGMRQVGKSTLMSTLQ